MSLGKYEQGSFVLGVTDRGWPSRLVRVSAGWWCRYRDGGKCSEGGRARWSHRASFLCDHHAMRRVVRALGARQVDLRPPEVVEARS